MSFDPGKHPRGRGGKWAEVLGKAVRVGKGEPGEDRSTPHRAFATDHLPDFAGSANAIRSVKPAPLMDRLAYSQARSEALSKVDTPAFEGAAQKALDAKDKVLGGVASGRENQLKASYRAGRESASEAGRIRALSPNADRELADHQAVQRGAIKSYDPKKGPNEAERAANAREMHGSELSPAARRAQATAQDRTRRIEAKRSNDLQAKVKGLKPGDKINAPASKGGPLTVHSASAERVVLHDASGNPQTHQLGGLMGGVLLSRMVANHGVTKANAREMHGTPGAAAAARTTYEAMRAGTRKTEGGVTTVTPKFTPPKGEPDYSTHSVADLARVARGDMKKVPPAAAPYLDAMHSLHSVDSNYGQDTGRDVVLRFVGNATSWRGDTARAVKAELRKRVKAPRRVQEGETMPTYAYERLQEALDRRDSAAAPREAVMARAHVIHWRHKLLQESSIPQAERDALVRKKQALSDGSYPIRNRADLENAITLARSGHGNVSAAKALIVRMAKKLNATDALPPDWNAAPAAT